MQLFGTSGIRRIADKGLLQLAVKVGLAVGNTCGRAVVACDTRTSSGAMKHAVTSGLLAAGSRCYDAGVLPTPTLALAARGFEAGVMITASHNPPQYNGIKLLNPDGCAFDSNQTRQIEETVLGDSCSTAPWNKMSYGDSYEEAVEQHIERILQDLPSKLKLKVVLDCGCGAAAMITPYLLKKLGCDMTDINCYPSGSPPHDVEPIEANLGDLIKATKELSADLGIAHDGDADRMMVVDNKGRFISGDKLMVILAQAVRAKDIITTIDASMAIEEIGFSVTRTRVGDTHVSEELRKGGDFGGEPSGCWVFPNISLCPDGIYAAALIASVASQQKLSLLVDKIPSYPLRRGSLSSEGVAMSKLEQRLKTIKPISVSNIDGMKLSFDDGWLLIRPSGTEPKIRITAEAKSEAKVRKLYNSGIEAIKECIDTGERR
jgi:phosphoglucosamine mutase